MNKKIYENPMIEVVDFDKEITTALSGITDGNSGEIEYPWGQNSGGEGLVV